MARAFPTGCAHVQRLYPLGTTAALHAMYALINGSDYSVNSSVLSPTTQCVEDTEFAKILRSYASAIVVHKTATGRAQPVMYASSATLVQRVSVPAQEVHAYLA